MDVGFALDLGGVLFREGIKVMDFDVFFFHDPLGDVVVDFGVAYYPAFGSVGDGSGVAPDEVGLGFLEALDELAEIGGVVFLGDLGFAGLVFGVGEVLSLWAHVFEIVESPVEMNDIPLLVLAASGEPFIDLLESFGCGAAVGERTMNVGLAFEHGADVDGVTDGNRVADEENAGEAIDVSDWAHWFVLFLGEEAGAEAGEEEERLNHAGMIINCAEMASFPNWMD